MNINVISKIVGCVAILMAFSATADEHENKNARNELAKMKRHELLQRPEILAELSHLQQQVSLLNNDGVSVSRLQAVEANAKTGANKLTIKIEKNKTAERVALIAKYLRRSKIMQQDPEFAHALLGEFGSLNGLLVQDAPETYTSLLSESAAVVPSVTDQIDRISHVIDASLAL